MHGNITGAARELASSHSAISQQLSLLERKTGAAAGESGPHEAPHAAEGRFGLMTGRTGPLHREFS